MTKTRLEESEMRGCRPQGRLLWGGAFEWRFKDENKLVLRSWQRTRPDLGRSGRWGPKGQRALRKRKEACVAGIQHAPMVFSVVNSVSFLTVSVGNSNSWHVFSAHWPCVVSAPLAQAGWLGHVHSVDGRIVGNSSSETRWDVVWSGIGKYMFEDDNFWVKIGLGWGKVVVNGEGEEGGMGELTGYKSNDYFRWSECVMTLILWDVASEPASAHCILSTCLLCKGGTSVFITHAANDY